MGACGVLLTVTPIPGSESGAGSNLPPRGGKGFWVGLASFLGYFRGNPMALVGATQEYENSPRSSGAKSKGGPLSGQDGRPRRPPILRLRSGRTDQVRDLLLCATVISITMTGGKLITEGAWSIVAGIGREGLVWGMATLLCGRS